jgi:hypothetical protein
MRDLFERSDQGRVRADLALFFGPHADAYLRVYDKMRERSRNWVMSWSWPGFFTPIVWLFYRKLYLYGALCTVIPLAIALAFDLSAGSGIAVVIALSARAWYVSAGLQHIGKADQLGLLGAERSDYLRRVGGVSPAAGVLVGLVHAALAALLIADIIGGSEPILHGDVSLGHIYTASAAAPR